MVAGYPSKRKKKMRRGLRLRPVVDLGRFPLPLNLRGQRKVRPQRVLCKRYARSGFCIVCLTTINSDIFLIETLEPNRGSYLQRVTAVVRFCLPPHNLHAGPVQMVVASNSQRSGWVPERRGNTPRSRDRDPSYHSDWSIRTTEYPPPQVLKDQGSEE